jgi:hypothetical protein
MAQPRTELLHFISGILFAIAGASLITLLFNELYVSYKNLEPGPDTVTILLDLLYLRDGQYFYWWAHCLVTFSI